MILHFYTCFSTCSFIIRLRGSGKHVRIDRNMRLMIHNMVYSGVCPCCFQSLFHTSQRSTDPSHLLPSSPMLVVSHGFPYQNAEHFSAPKGAEMCHESAVLLILFAPARRFGLTLRGKNGLKGHFWGEDVRNIGEQQMIEAFQMYYI